MSKLIIIDDSNCKEELNSFLDSNAECIKLLISEDEYNINIDTLIEKLQASFSDQQILFFGTSNNVIKVTINQVKYLQLNNSQVELFLVNGDSHILPQDIEYYKTKLEKHNIIQINSKTLINCRIVDKFLIPEEQIFLTKGDSFMVDNKHIQNILTKLNNIEI
ncbi:MAG: hypothetical protein GQ564_01170 [Bacteroidales bacterium]|nr:hypothetical protein [Bacteroidales bacterium]